MDIKTFLGRVLPPEGCGSYVLTLIKDKIAWNQGNYDTIDALAAAALKWDKTEWSVYFAVGTHKDNEYEKDGKKKFRRKKETAYAFKCLCIDIDVGPDKPYQTQKQAYMALAVAVKNIGIPMPMVNSSGGGLHGYWPLLKAISAANWEKAGIYLRAALTAQGVEIDTSKVHDPSMVLRPVETTHKKDSNNLRKVRVISDCEDIGIADMVTLLKQAVPQGVNLTPTPAATKAPAGSIIGNVLNTAYDKLNLDHLIEGCQQLRAIAADAGANCKYPMWLASLNVAKNCTDVPVALDRLCGGHPDYDQDKCLEKIATFTKEGTTLCSTFETANPGGCNGCPHKGTINSVASLHRGSTVVAEKEVTFEVPEPYAIRNGQIVRHFTDMKTVEDEDGKKRKVEFQNTEVVSPYLMYVESRYTDADYNSTVARVAVKFPVGGWRSFDLPIAHLCANNAEYQKLLGDKEIYLQDKSQGHTKLRSYLLTYLQQLQQYAESSFKYRHFGWQRDGTFLLGHKLIGLNEHRDFSLDGPAERMSQQLQPKGTLQGWIDATAAFDNSGLDLHACAFLIGLGSPLMVGSKLGAGLLHLYSSQTGSGKSSVQQAIMSAYGDPIKLMMKPSDTDNSMFMKLGILNALTACMDEMTETINTDQARAHNLMYLFTAGMDRGTLNQNRELREQGSWSMNIVWSSNSDLEGQLDSRVTSSALRMRLMQFTVDQNPYFLNHGKEFVTGFLNNYGHVMTPIIEEIIRRGGPEAVFNEAAARFEKMYKFKFLGPERFIHAMYIAAEGVREIAVSLGLLKFDTTKAIPAGLATVDSKRAYAEQSHRDGMDLLGQYLLERNHAIVECVEEVTTPNHKMKVKLPTPNVAYVRYEIMRRNGVPFDGVIHINRADLRRWLQTIGGDFDAVTKDLTKLGVEFTDNVRISIMKGCEKSNPGQTYCLSIKLNHRRMLDALSHPDIPVEISTHPQAQTVGAMANVLRGNK